MFFLVPPDWNFAPSDSPDLIPGLVSLQALTCCLAQHVFVHLQFKVFLCRVLVSTQNMYLHRQYISLPKIGPLWHSISLLCSNMISCSSFYSHYTIDLVTWWLSYILTTPCQIDPATLGLLTMERRIHIDSRTSLTGRIRLQGRQSCVQNEQVLSCKPRGGRRRLNCTIQTAHYTVQCSVQYTVYTAYSVSPTRSSSEDHGL